jgi:hypothetical protein
MRYQSEEQLRQVLSGTYLRKKPATDQRKIELLWPQAFFGLDKDNNAALEDVGGDVESAGMDNKLATSADEDALGAPDGKDVKRTARQDRHAESSAARQDSDHDATDDRAVVEQSSPAPDGSRGTS